MVGRINRRRFLQASAAAAAAASVTGHAPAAQPPGERVRVAIVGVAGLKATYEAARASDHYKDESDRQEPEKVVEWLLR